MHSFVVLFRGINVGGKNKVPMADLRECLEGLGFSEVQTYIASGNAIVRTDRSKDEVRRMIQAALPRTLTLDSELVKVLVLSSADLQNVVDSKPKGFGEQPGTYHSDVIFLIDVSVDDAMSVFNPREGVDKVWPGPGVVYSQRLSALRTKSRLSKIMGAPQYKSMTIRTWGTVEKLAGMSSKSL